MTHKQVVVSYAFTFHRFKAIPRIMTSLLITTTDTAADRKLLRGFLLASYQNTLNPCKHTRKVLCFVKKYYCVSVLTLSGNTHGLTEENGQRSITSIYFSHDCIGPTRNSLLNVYV
jgi:hypothetical protein